MPGEQTFLIFCIKRRWYAIIVNLLRDTVHEIFIINAAKQMITCSSWDYLYINESTGFRVRSVQPNRQKCPWHWKRCEPLEYMLVSLSASINTKMWCHSTGRHRHLGWNSLQSPDCPLGSMTACICNHYLCNYSFAKIARSLIASESNFYYSLLYFETNIPKKELTNRTFR